MLQSMVCFATFTAPAGEPGGGPGARHVENIICFAPFQASVGWATRVRAGGRPGGGWRGGRRKRLRQWWARRSARSEKCGKHNMFCYILSIGCLGDQGATCGGQARMVQNMLCFATFTAPAGGPGGGPGARNVENIICFAPFQASVGWATRVRAGGATRFWLVST